MDQSQFLNRVAKDQNFRDDLRRNPKSALAQAGTDTGDVEIKVVQDTATVRHITMPHNPNVLLDDGSLEKVAGGGWNPFKKIKSLGASSFSSFGSCVSSADIADVH